MGGPNATTVAGPYSPFKIIHHAEHVADLRAGKQAAPVQVQLVISDLCSHKCSFCAFRMEGYSSNQLFGIKRDDGSVNNNPNRMIPTEKVLEILDDCRDMGVKAIQITGGGEPTVHPQHPAIFAAVLERGMELAVVSHGARWSQDTIEQLSRAKWVRVSVDAGKPDTYAAIRGVDQEQFNRAWRNVAKLVANRDKLGTGVRVGVSFVVTLENWREIPLAVRMAKDAGADNIRLGAMFQPEGAAYYNGILDDVRELAEIAAAEAVPGVFAVLNNFSRRYADLEQGRPDYERCWYQHSNTYIGGDQEVYRCCTLAYNEAGKLGSLVGRRFRDVWAEAAANMAAFDAKSCSRCPFNAQNHAAAYVLSPDPADVNFV